MFHKASKITAFVAAASIGAGTASAGTKPLAAWTGAPAGTTGIIPPGTQTLREIISPRVSGNTVRLRLTNRLGTAAVHFGVVYIGEQQSGAAIAAGSNKALHFSGHTFVTLQPGEDVLSDPLPYSVTAFKKLAISMQVGTGDTIPPLSETHSVSRELNYFSLVPSVVGGGAAPESATGFRPFTLTQGALFQASWHYINELDVESSFGTPRVVVSFGDSITDGLQVNKTLENTFVERIDNLGLEQRYEDYIQKRLNGFSQKYTQFSFVDEGIAGNRLLAGPFVPFFGPSGLDRLSTDAIRVRGATDAIIGLGINDIAFDIPAQATGSHAIGPKIEQGYELLAKRLHAAGIRVVMTTMLPAYGAEASQFAPALDALSGAGVTPVQGGALHGTKVSDDIRREVNTWIKGEGRGLFDAVVDLSTCMEDPKDPRKLNHIYDSGDHLHPNAAGYSHMADCTPIALAFGPGSAQ